MEKYKISNGKNNNYYYHCSNNNTFLLGTTYDEVLCINPCIQQSNIDMRPDYSKK